MNLRRAGAGAFSRRVKGLRCRHAEVGDVNPSVGAGARAAVLTRAPAAVCGLPDRLLIAGLPDRHLSRAFRIVTLS